MTDQPEEQKPLDPEAAHLKRLEIVKAWIARLERCVRQKSYTLAPMIFHPNLVWMGIESNICSNLEQATKCEFRELWPKCLGFSVDLSKAHIIPDAQSMLVIVPWVAGNIIIGAPQLKGRLTLVLGMFQAGKILAIHGHMSLNPLIRLER